MFYFILFLLSPFLLSSYQYKLAMATVTKDEASYLLEWISYHHSVGVEHFYIYDNNEGKETYNVLEPLIKQGLVEYKYWPDVFPPPFYLNCQPKAYLHAIQKASNKAEWIALIDTDEFLLPRTGKSVPEILKKFYKNADVIAVNWRLFGTANKNLGPGGKLLPNLTMASNSNNGANRYIKTLVKPKAVKHMGDPHFVHTNKTYFNGSGGLYIKGQIETKLLRINHYTYRDEWFLMNVKVQRMSDWKKNSNGILEMIRENNDNFSLYEDTEITTIR